MAFAGAVPSVQVPVTVVVMGIVGEATSVPVGCCAVMTVGVDTVCETEIG